MKNQFRVLLSFLLSLILLIPAISVAANDADYDTANATSFVFSDSGITVNGDTYTGYKVKGTVIKQFRDDKVIAYKKRRRQGYERKRGHRQYKTLVLIKSIEM